MAPISFKILFLASLLLFSLCLGTRSVDGARGVEEPAKCSTDQDCESSCPIWGLYRCKSGSCECTPGEQNQNDVVVGAEQIRNKGCLRDSQCESFCPEGSPFKCDHFHCKCDEEEKKRCLRDSSCESFCPVGSRFHCHRFHCKCDQEEGADGKCTTDPDCEAACPVGSDFYCDNKECKCQEKN